MTSLPLWRLLPMEITQTIYFGPCGVNNGVFGGTYTAGGTSATLSWSGASNTIASEYIIQRISPGAEAGGWQTVADVPVSGYFSSDQYGLNYTYTANNLTPSPIGSDGGYLWRIGAKTSLATSDAPGAPGVSGYTPATPLNGIAAPDGQVSFTSPYSNIALTPTGGWTPSSIDSENNPVTFGSNQSLTFNMNNLPAHMSYYVTFGPNVYGDSTEGDTFTLTGPHGIDIVATPTTMNLLDVAVPDDGTDTSATFTLDVHLGGTGRSWTIGEPGVYIAKGNVSSTPAGVANAGVVVGGETDVTVSFNSAYISDPAGTVLTVKNYDADVVQPTVTTLTLDSNGDAVLPVVGTGLGTGTIILQDAAGDQGLIVATVFGPSVSSTGNVVQGATYGPSNMPGFTFSIGSPSVTPVVISYSTAGSTLPSSLMGTMSSETVTIPAGQTSVFVPFTVADDGKIAPQRTLVETLTAAEGGGQAYMQVHNNDLPGITIDGQQSGANVTLDPTDENSTSLLAPVAFTISKDGALNSATLTWNPNQDVIWLSDKVGEIGVGVGNSNGSDEDLADMPGVTSDSYGDHYTWTGLIPTKLFAQAIGGSTNTDGSSVSLGATVSKLATQIVSAATTSPWATAEATQAGIYIDVTAAGLVSDTTSKPPTAGDVVIGAGITVTVGYLGPNPLNLPFSGIDWTIAGATTSPQSATAIAGYSVSTGSGVVSVITPTALQQGSVHFYFLAGGNPNDVRSISVDADLGDQGYNAKINLHVLTPSSTFKLHALSSTEVGALAPPPTPQFPFIHLGTTVGTGNPGIEAVGDADMPAGVGGTLGEFQFGTFSNVRINMNGPLISFMSYMNAADTAIPYGDVNTPQRNHAAAGASAEVTLDDSPKHPLAGASSMLVDEHFQDYLMYKPDGDGIWVPLRKPGWGWGGTVQGKSQFSFIGDPTQPDSIVNSTAATVEPTWNSNIPRPPKWTDIPGL